MYLPLAGDFEERKKGYKKVSINSIGSAAAVYTVQPPSEAAATQSEPQKLDQNNTEHQPLSAQAATGHSQSILPASDCSHEMSTQDFLSLRAQTQEDPYQVLDEVISRMKEDMKLIGDVLEKIAEMSEEASQSKLALTLLEKTFAAIDEMRGDG
tara:strand:- start:603 stop:1064 length:462 start_codon:yes stop_codon:yes gene_type:complete